MQYFGFKFYVNIMSEVIILVPTIEIFSNSPHGLKTLETKQHISVFLYDLHFIVMYSGRDLCSNPFISHSQTVS